MDDIKPLSLFRAEPVDFSLHRPPHCTGTSVKHLQRFFLLTNYQRYIEVFHTFRRRPISHW
jgi:AMP nucleosidase